MLNYTSQETKEKINKIKEALLVFGAQNSEYAASLDYFAKIVPCKLSFVLLRVLTDYRASYIKSDDKEMTAGKYAQLILEKNLI